MKCRILYLVGQLGPGGLEHQLYLLLQAMDRDRYRPEVVVWNFRKSDTYVGHIQKLGVPLHSFPGTLSATAKLLAFRRLALVKQPEVIHSFSFYTNIASWWATLGTKAIAIGAVRSDFIRDKKGCGFLLGNLCARFPKIQVYNNLASAKTARRYYSLFAPKSVFVVRNGLDLAQFQRAPLSLNGRVRVLGVGSLLPVKRWDRLLVAALALKDRGFDFLVEIAGGGPLRERLEKQAQDLGVIDCVKLRGHIDDIPALLSRATFLAHTSDFEGCPNVVMEAMACGRAVVATDAGDIPSLVEDGKTGFVVPRGDDARLVDRLAALISNRDLCCKMGEAGRAKAEREFSLERLVNETLTTYKAAGWNDPCHAGQ
jgi:glycosyltransferase involved in cell wall biosynthesis